MILFYSFRVFQNFKVKLVVHAEVVFAILVVEVENFAVYNENRGRKPTALRSYNEDGGRNPNRIEIIQ